jgi:ATP-dependent helicase/nuclease subunit A
MPEATQIFSGDSIAEVSVAIDAPADGPRMVGRIDRLVVTDREVRIIDIKTDASPPVSDADVDQPYLAQLGAYAAGIAPAWPDREISAAFLWTAGPQLMPVPLESALDAYSRANFTRNTRS